MRENVPAGINTRRDCSLLFTSISFADVISLFGRDKANTLQRVCGRTSPPVPYRIAKALHPALYRNVELDIVQEERRENKQRTLEACKGFSVGDKCHVILEENEERPYTAHIQFIDDQQGAVTLFVEELGIKKSVPVNSICPLPLQVNKQGDNLPVLPVAELDLLQFQKKGRKKKHQQGLPAFTAAAAVSDRSCAGQQYPHRDQSNPGHSSIINSSNNCYSSTSACSVTTTITTTAASSNSVISYPASCSSTGSVSNYAVVDNSHHISVSRASVAAVPIAYQQINTFPSCEAGIQGSCYISSTAVQYNNNRSSFDLSPAPRYCYPTASYPPQQGELMVAVDPSQQHCIMSSGSSPAQGPMYWMPVVAVPYPSNMGQVNMGWSHSQDPYMKELQPSSGIEFYRMSANPQSTTYPSSVIYQPQNSQEMNQSMTVMVDNCGNYTNVAPVVCTETQAGTNGMSSLDASAHTIHTCDSSNDGIRIVPKSETIFAVNRAENKVARGHINGLSDQKHRQDLVSSSSNGNAKNDDKMLLEIQDSLATRRDDDGKLIDSGKDSKADDDEDDSASEGMDARSDGDSGCPSECADLSPVGGPGSSEMSPSEGGDLLDNPKPRGKRRYYMYGNHKLIKPIKEIPLRFQILLAETSAAKARCEGQPIYMQQQQALPQTQSPMYDCVYYPASDGIQPQLNANATCFIPSQDSPSDTSMTPTYVSECFNMCSMAGYPNSASGSMANHPTTAGSMQPAPLFVPPIAPPPCVPAHTTTSQNCQTIIVYSSHSSSSSIAPSSSSTPNQQIRSVVMPPPYPPPPAFPPPHMEHVHVNPATCISPAVNQLPQTLPTTHSQPSVPPTDHHMKTSYSSHTTKPPMVLNIPPPNHTLNVQPQTSPQKPPANHIAPIPTAPPPNHCKLANFNTPTHVPMPQPLNPPSDMPSLHINGSYIQSPSNGYQGYPNSTGSPHSVPYPASTNQYMYIYPSPPTGQPATPTHVVYMVNPAYPPAQTYQQPGVFVPPSCPVPVQ